MELVIDTNNCVVLFDNIIQRTYSNKNFLNVIFVMAGNH